MAKLSDGRVTIRTPTDGDAEAVAAAVQASLAELAPWMPWATPDYDAEGAREWMASGDSGNAHPFLILDEVGAIVGSTGLNEVSRLNATANLGYWIRTDRWGEGFATAAARLVARYGHRDLGLHRLEITMSVANEASRRVAERLGAHYEGVHRGRLLLDGEYHDTHVFSLLPGDLQDGEQG